MRKEGVGSGGVKGDGDKFAHKFAGCNYCHAIVNPYSSKTFSVLLIAMLLVSRLQFHGRILTSKHGSMFLLVSCVCINKYRN